MNKKNRLFATIGLVFSCGLLMACTSQTDGLKATPEEVQSYYVDFFNNYLREDFELSNGTKGKGNNLIYLSTTVPYGQKVEKPADPTRKNYEFQGWYLEKNCENAWDFGKDQVQKNTRLFAKWGVAQKEEGVEPEYTPPSTVLSEDAAQDFVINSVMNFKINNGQVRLSKAAQSSQRTVYLPN